MKVIETRIDGAFIIEPQVFGDERGYFFESYNKLKHQNSNLNYNFIQDNDSLSSKGVLRGLHYQVGEYSQAKLVRVVYGKVKDIIVDIREGSPFYGQSVEVILSEENKRQLLVPRGFAHGFVVLSESALFSYKCDNFYNKESEASIHPLCPILNLDWEMKEGSEDFILSEKDSKAPHFGEHKKSDVAYTQI